MKLHDRRELVLIAKAAESLGCEPIPDPKGFLTTIMPTVGPGATDGTEGQFSVEPQADGSWKIWWTPGNTIEVAGDLSPNALAALVAEALRDARRECCEEFEYPAPLPCPPPMVRTMPKHDLAEQTVASALAGERVTGGDKGYAVLVDGQTRVQVTSWVRSAQHGPIPTTRLGSDSACEDHDVLVYIEFSPDNYPLKAWQVDSNAYRNEFPNDREPRAVKSFLDKAGKDITALIQQSFDRLFMP